ncbi:PucR family transcriptional regulator [Paenibacillus pinistramenti]|uniref:PucR family transcriptional regulator n=1 Tax=Paenibacillus pinistramenti TaxID=1768003 RepID=UPI001EF0BEB3|nr:PucR family transcriptional regulator [Paenibacillus pinistramenti]
MDDNRVIQSLQGKDSTLDKGYGKAQGDHRAFERHDMTDEKELARAHAHAPAPDQRHGGWTGTEGRELDFTVLEALARPLFAGARVAAGERGLARPVRWVHVLESANFESLIHGEEMILTTGVGFTADGMSPVTFMDNLIKKNAACLCIEAGPYFREIPAEMAALAEERGFPLILFPQTVRFVDITLDLHSLIINRHHLMLQELESTSRAFYKLSLTSQGTQKILQLLQQNTQTQIVYYPLQGKPLVLPALPSGEQQAYTDYLAGLAEEHETQSRTDHLPAFREFRGRQAVIKPVGALDQTWAYLMLLTPGRPREYDCLLLDSASLSIAQELLRTRYMEERKWFTENLWVDDLLGGRLTEDSRLKAMAGPDFLTLNESPFRVCMLELRSRTQDKWNAAETEWETARFHLPLLLRSIFEKYAFRPLMTMKNNRIAVIALDLKAKQPSKLRLQQALNGLLHIAAGDKFKDHTILIGVSKPRTGLKNAAAACSEASQALGLQPCSRSELLFYEDLGVFQLLMSLNDGTTLESFIRSYLGPLIDHDECKGSELLLTLRVFLDHDGSKQIAARKLFIVRQSLYYRLEKITELLGEDFMEPENRISIQVALRAYQFLHPEKFTLPETRSSQL